MNPVFTLIAVTALATGSIAASAANIYYVGPTGDDASTGTQAAPFQTLAQAVSVVSPGDTILMHGGRHSYATTVAIDKAGTSNSPIRIAAFPGERPVLDYSSWKPEPEAARAGSRGIFITTNAHWWVLKGLEICYAPDNGVKSEGGHITFDQCVFHHNGDTGLQIGLSKGKIKFNPDPDNIAAYNLVLNCDAYRNADVATKYESADGFACKLHAGKGNKFIGCRAWENADDGWDFFSHEGRDCARPLLVVAQRRSISLGYGEVPR